MSDEAEKASPQPETIAGWRPLTTATKDNIEWIIEHRTGKGHKLAYTKADLPKLEDAFEKTVAKINEVGREYMLEAEKLMHEVKWIDIIRGHEINGTFCLYRDYIIPELITGRKLDDIVQDVMHDYARKKPFKAQMIAKTMPTFCEAMGLPVPQCVKGKLSTCVVVIDDSLNMDLKERNIACNPRNIFKDAKPPVVLYYLHSPQGLESLQNELKTMNLHPDVIICDYKLHRPGEPELWGDKVLEDFCAKLPVQPKHKFLISKSGFRDEDKAALAAKGIAYAHSNELHAIAAYQAKDEANLQFATEVAKTSTLREWANKQFGTHYPTGIYAAPDVSVLEKGKTPVQEVMRRIDTAKATQLEAYQLLDKASLGGAFREQVDMDARPVGELEMASLPPGIPGGSFVGKLALSAKAVEEIAASGKTPVLFVLDEDYKPSHNPLIKQINGLVMLKSGTNHIAVMARNKGIPVAFARAANSSIMSVEGDKLMIRDRGLGESVFAREGDEITFDGEHFRLIKGALPLLPPNPEAKDAVRRLAKLSSNHIGLSWHVKGEPDYRGVQVMANIGSFEDISALAATQLPCHGIGLLRTEHLLRDEDGMARLQAAVIKGDEASLAALRSRQQDDFGKLFEAMAQKHKSGNFPVTVRLLDAPAAEFFPAPGDSRAVAECAEKIGVDVDRVKDACRRLGDEKLQGATLAVQKPELYRAQCEAIFAAAREKKIKPRIMVPHVRSVEELKAVRAIVEQAATTQGMQGEYQFGPLLETRDIVVLGSPWKHKDRMKALAEASDFVSYGTNDLTQELLDLPRGDLLALAKWQADNQRPYDPFVTLDKTVRDAIATTTKELRAHKPLLPVGVCGQQAASAADADFFQKNRISSISVPPTEEYLCRGLIQSGAAALALYTQERERLTADRRTAEAMAQPTSSAPRDVLIREKSLAFVVVEDDATELQRLRESLAGKPVVFAEDLAGAMAAIEAQAAKGNQVVLITDMQLPFGSEDQRPDLQKKYDWIKNEDDDMKWGVALANAARAGKIQGVDTDHVALMTAGDPKYYNLSEGVQVLDKRGKLVDACTAFIEARLSVRDGWADAGQKKSIHRRG